jgi:hypothetical protein
VKPLRTIAVDWSGARTGAERKIWLAEVRGRQVTRLESGRTRESVTQELVHAVHESENVPTVIGLDFSFGFPAWYTRAQGWNSAPSMWRAWTPERVEHTLRVPEFPFWGRGAQRTRPAALHDQSETPPLRATEIEQAERTSRPFSVFQLVGAGAVGPGTLRGMATLDALHAAGATIWPFSDIRANTTAVVVEIWPRLYAPHVNKSNAEARVAHLRALSGATRDLTRYEPDVSNSDDAFDALVGALALADGFNANTLKQSPSNSAISRVEGTIWRPELP